MPESLFTSFVLDDEKLVKEAVLQGWDYVLGKYFIVLVKNSWLRFSERENILKTNLKDMVCVCVVLPCTWRLKAPDIWTDYVFFY